MRIAIAAFSLCMLLASPTRGRAAGTVYYLTDSTGSPWVGGVPYALSFGDVDPNNPGRPNVGLFNTIMRHEFLNPLGGTPWEKPPTTPGGTTIRWTFDISNLEVVSEYSNGKADLSPLTLTGLAHLGGFDHFNYQQYILGIPSYLKASVISDGPPRDLRPPYLDPYPNEPANLVQLTNRTSGLYAYIYDTDPQGKLRPIDSYGYYYNDDTSLIGNYAQFQTKTSISFRDAPTKPKYLAFPSSSPGSTLYQTSLVGVGADHSLVGKWTGWGTNITWSSNTFFYNININYGYDGNPFDQGPAPDGGGIADVRTDAPAAVPEPPSSILLGIGATAMMLCVAFRGGGMGRCVAGGVG